MRIIVYGAGAVGGLTGGFLARAGQTVILVGRPANVKAINENGLKIVSPLGTDIIKVPAVTHPNQIDFKKEDKVLLCVKGQDTEAAVSELRKVTRQVPVFCLQNGVRNEEITNKYFSSVYGAVVWTDAAYINPGEVLAGFDPIARYAIGRYPQGTDNNVESLVSTLRNSGLMAFATRQIMPYKWNKLIMNLANSIIAITGKSARELKNINSAVVQESQGILNQKGIRWMTTEDIIKEWPEFATPIKSHLETNTQGSTWQSLMRQQGSVETDFLNGEIVRLAKELGQSAPLNEKLLQITNEMAAKREKPGKYTPEQLSKLLGLDKA